MSLIRRLFVDVATASRLDLDAEAIRRVEKRFNDAASSDRRLIALIAVGVTMMIVFGWAIGSGLMLLAKAFGLGKSVGITVAAIGTPCLLIAVWFSTFPLFTRRTLRRILRECGYNVCGRCGYLLDGLAEPARCPECGKKEQPPLGEAAA